MLEFLRSFLFDGIVDASRKFCIFYEESKYSFPGAEIEENEFN